MNPEELKEIQRLFAQGMAIRAIARKLGRNVKTIRQALTRPPQTNKPSKLSPFLESIKELASKGLMAPRILRELRSRGYTGSLTILKDTLRQIRGPRKAAKRAYRRFETKKAVESQSDWSPYWVKIAGIKTLIHCFSMVLCYSRMLFVAFYRNEKLPTLLYAHTEALKFFDGCTRSILYDNQTAITLGRLKGKPLWNPTFMQFAKHYGFKPRVHKPRHAERSGKVERPFQYVEGDFLRASEFASWEDLNQKAREWLTTVANKRVHQTTRRVPEEAFKEEHPFLIRLPEFSFAAERREVRKVQKDAYICVDGTFYPVPERLVGQHVSVRVHPHRVEILDASGSIATAHAIPDHPTRVWPSGEPSGPSEPTLSRSALEANFLARFPEADVFLDGLKRRMNALVPIHLRQIERLVQLYSQGAVREAIERAMTYRNFSALSIERILQARYPNVIAEPPAQLLGADPAALGALDDVDAGSPADYTLDTEPPTQTDGGNDAQKR